MTEQTSVARWVAIGFVAIGIASGLWLAVSLSQETPKDMREVADTTASVQQEGETRSEPTSPPAPQEPIVSPPDYQIEEGGRLSLNALSLPTAGVITFGLALDREALGTGRDPLSAVVISAGDERRLELSAEPVAGLRSSVRLEVDASWLRPGMYMIQIRTAEKTALPLRRYVLEVRAALGPEQTREGSGDMR
jgi:hypothetical protein